MPVIFVTECSLTSIKKNFPEFLTLPQPVPPLCASPGAGVPCSFPAGKGRVPLPEVGPATPASAQVRGPGLPGLGWRLQASLRRPGRAGPFVRGGGGGGSNPELAAMRGAMPPPKDVVKIAIQMVGAIPQLIELEQVLPATPAPLPGPPPQLTAALPPSGRPSRSPQCSRTSVMREYRARCPC